MFGFLFSFSCIPFSFQAPSFCCSAISLEMNFSLASCAWECSTSSRECCYKPYSLLLVAMTSVVAFIFNW
ncbi:hypothetical protein EUGRSUZ_K02892 [Eucalyptus grandis]|uniref:Uncharacterized protein n=2 Tax=Eucalyptus grandis TaxID=71139 RepID=A0ACC3IYE1_EUCGR|nr:hypothetical protein EUGRSUZ_K02892 [Eucalyptus grandis]